MAEISKDLGNSSDPVSGESKTRRAHEIAKTRFRMTLQSLIQLLSMCAHTYENNIGQTWGRY